MEENSKNKEKMEAESLTVTHILGPLFLILFGHLLAGMTLVIEILWTKHLKKLNIVAVLNKWKTYGNVQ